MKGIYEELKAHVGHRIVCVTYAEGHSLENIAIECESCNEVIMDADREPTEEVQPKSRKGIGSSVCGTHGEYFLDAPDSPCPSCEDER